MIFLIYLLKKPCGWGRATKNQLGLAQGISSKFYHSLSMVRTINLLMTSESKLDNTLPSQQFSVNGYSTLYRLDRNENCGGIPL